MSSLIFYIVYGRWWVSHRFEFLTDFKGRRQVLNVQNRCPLSHVFPRYLNQITVTKLTVLDHFTLPLFSQDENLVPGKSTHFIIQFHMARISFRRSSLGHRNVSIYPPLTSLPVAHRIIALRKNGLSYVTFIIIINYYN